MLWAFLEPVRDWASFKKAPFTSPENKINNTFLFKNSPFCDQIFLILVAVLKSGQVSGK
jgi:hypothetical protein